MVVGVDAVNQVCSIVVEMTANPKVGYTKPAVFQILSHLNKKVAIYNQTALHQVFVSGFIMITTVNVALQSCSFVLMITL